MTNYEFNNLIELNDKNPYLYEKDLIPSTFTSKSTLDRYKRESKNKEVTVNTIISSEMKKFILYCIIKSVGNSY